MLLLPKDKKWGPGEDLIIGLSVFVQGGSGENDRNITENWEEL